MGANSEKEIHTLDTNGQSRGPYKFRPRHGGNSTIRVQTTGVWTGTAPIVKTYTGGTNDASVIELGGACDVYVTATAAMTGTLTVVITRGPRG